MSIQITYAGRTYTLTTDHAASSYGVPVLVAADGTAFGRDDVAHRVSGGLLFHGVEVTGGSIVELEARIDPDNAALQDAARRFLGCAHA